MGLSKEEILFIDNYLSQAGMNYIDMRLEWVDHVATSIEAQMDEDKSLVFYDIFKAFMLTHKKEILKTYEDQMQKVGTAVLVRYCKGFLKLDVLLLALILIVIVTNIEVLPFIERCQEYLLCVPLSVMLLFAVLYMKGKKVSETRGLLVLSGMFFLGTYYFGNPYMFFTVIILALLVGWGVDWLRNRYGEQKSFWFIMLCSAVLAPFITAFQEWTKSYIGDGAKIVFFCVLLLFVYVLAKTVIQTLNNIRLKKKRISLIQ